MADFEAKELDLSLINNGKRFEYGDAVTPDAINAPIEAAAWAKENLVNKVLTETENLQIYGKNKDGSQSMFDVGDGSYDIVQRGYNGEIFLPSTNPNGAYVAAHKKYVDDNKGVTLYLHTVTVTRSNGNTAKIYFLSKSDTAYGYENTDSSSSATYYFSLPTTYLPIYFFDYVILYHQQTYYNMANIVYIDSAGSVQTDTISYNGGDYTITKY